MKDRAGNVNADIFGFPVHEILDDKLPLVASMSLNLTTGIFQIAADETVDVTPFNYIDPSLIYLVNNATSKLSLSESSLLSTSDGLSFELELSERERVFAIESSDTPGGDGAPFKAEIFAGGAFRDIAQNFVAEADNLTVSQAADILPPRVTSGLLDFSDGRITLFATEFIDATPASKIDLSKFSIANVSGTEVISLSGTTVTTIDGSVFNLTLPEQKRARCHDVFKRPWG